MFCPSTADIIGDNKIIAMKYKNSTLTIAIIATLSFLLIFAFACTKEKPSAKMLKETLEQVKIVGNKSGILHEEYKLSFNDAVMDHTKYACEDNSGNVKMESPTFTAVRKIAGDKYEFYGSNTKNDFYDKFEVEKEHFEHHAHEVKASTLINTYISRGITMYTALGPKQFWPRLINIFIKDTKTKMKTTKAAYEFDMKDSKSQIKLIIDKKTKLPLSLTMKIDAEKIWHDEAPYSKVTLSVVKRNHRPLSKAKSIFARTIPKEYKLRNMVIKKHFDHEHDADETGCNSCHDEDLSLKRYEKTRFTLF